MLWDRFFRDPKIPDETVFPLVVKSWFYLQPVSYTEVNERINHFILSHIFTIIVTDDQTNYYKYQHNEERN